MPVPGRVCAAAVTALAALLGAASPASAHNGTGAAFKGQAGRYTGTSHRLCTRVVPPARAGGCR